MVSSGGFSWERLVFGLPAILIALPFHEFAHAYVADKMGDPTPRFQGRLTIDIRKHIDPIGLLLFMVAGFGWAKPVETDVRKLKNPRIGMAVIALAGPSMNFILGILTIIIASKTGLFIDGIGFIGTKLGMLLYFIAMYNIFFGIFNMIPIPPLDGSRIITIFMSPKTFIKYGEFEYKNQAFLLIGLMAVILVFTEQVGYVINYLAGYVVGFATIISNLLTF